MLHSLCVYRVVILVEEFSDGDELIPFCGQFVEDGRKGVQNVITVVVTKNDGAAFYLSHHPLYLTYYLIVALDCLG